MRCDVSSTIPKPSTRVHHGSHRLTEDKKLHFLKSQVKILLVWFYDLEGIIHREFIPEGETVTGKYYLDAMQHLWWRINRSRPEYQDSGSWYLLHNNSPPQKATVAAELLAKKKSLCHSRLVVFTRFVAVWLLLVPKWWWKEYFMMILKPYQLLWWGLLRQSQRWTYRHPSMHWFSMSSSALMHKGHILNKHFKFWQNMIFIFCIQKVRFLFKHTVYFPLPSKIITKRRSNTQERKMDTCFSIMTIWQHKVQLRQWISWQQTNWVFPHPP